MKRFNDYTDTELLSLDNETINDAIRIEAIQRGVKPPITLSEALRKSEWVGYQKPAESVEVFEIITTHKYGSPENSGIGFLSKERAESAIVGCVAIHHETYGNDKGWKLLQGDVGIASRFCGVSKADQAWAKLEEFKQDDTDFNVVSDECVERLSRVRQDDYNKRVNAEKKSEYLRLSGGDEQIAKAFWNKVESAEWPAD